MSGPDTIVESANPDDILTNVLDETHEDNHTFDNPRIDKDRRKSIIPPSHLPKSANNKKGSDVDSDKSDNENGDDFDAFILNNFVPFTGQENVIEWLDNIDEKFNSFKISRNLRYIAVPLLVEKEAKRKYIFHRNNIKSFDDFYEFLLINYNTTEGKTERITSNSNFIPSHHHLSHQNPSSSKSISFDDQQKTMTNTFDLSDNLPPRPILRSTAIVDVEATSFPGDESVHRSTIAPSSNTSHNASYLNQTTYVIHKALVDNIIKNPKIFQGGKEDVKQWLEEIEQLFDTAQIPDNHKLDLVPYSLRGEARRWYKNNKSSFTSWKTFVVELKEAFPSPFYEELAFKKLESYSQGINQPVRSFYNEVVKLCNETDPSMTDSTKLRHLLNKVKPTLQLEIRKKRPTTTRQFLEYAKEIEELFQLANIDAVIDNSANNSNSANQITSTVTLARSNTSNSNIEPTARSTFNQNMNQHNYRGNNNHNTNRNNNYNFHSSRSFNSPTSSFRRNNPTTSNEQYYSNTQRSNYNPPYHSSSQGYNSSSHSSHNNRNYRNYDNETRVPQVNNINVASSSSPSNSSQPSICSHPDTPSQQTGHQTTGGSRF